MELMMLVISIITLYKIYAMDELSACGRRARKQEQISRNKKAGKSTIRLNLCAIVRRYFGNWRQHLWLKYYENPDKESRHYKCLVCKTWEGKRNFYSK